MYSTPAQISGSATGRHPLPTTCRFICNAGASFHLLSRQPSEGGPYDEYVSDPMNPVPYTQRSRSTIRAIL